MDFHCPWRHSARLQTHCAGVWGRCCLNILSDGSEMVRSQNWARSDMDACWNSVDTHRIRFACSLNAALEQRLFGICECGFHLWKILLMPKNWSVLTLNTLSSSPHNHIVEPKYRQCYFELTFVFFMSDGTSQSNARLELAPELRATVRSTLSKWKKKKQIKRFSEIIIWGINWLAETCWKAKGFGATNLMAADQVTYTRIPEPEQHKETKQNCLISILSYLK